MVLLMSFMNQNITITFLLVSFAILTNGKKYTTFWTTPLKTHCPCSNQTRESFQSIRFALDTTSSQFQGPVKLQTMRFLLRRHNCQIST